MYGIDLSLSELRQSRHDQTYEEFNIEFKRDVKFLHRYFAIEALKAQVEANNQQATVSS